MKKTIAAFVLLLFSAGIASAASVGTVTNETNAKNAQITANSKEVTVKGIITGKRYKLKSATNQDIGVVEIGAGAKSQNSINNETNVEGAKIHNSNVGKVTYKSFFGLF